MYPEFNNTYRVLGQVESERDRQDARWGEQNHPDVDVPETGFGSYRAGYELEANAWKGNNDARVKSGTLAWDGILLEEVYEALAESDPTNLRAELIQVAAVAVAWVEAIDRRTSTTEGDTK